MRLIIIAFFLSIFVGCQRDTIRQLEENDKTIDQKMQILYYELDSLKKVKSKLWDMP